ncbi:odorant receptor Or2-like [Neodiprion virginianus]|uniref:odorant receptor Or2-like n=1 Tax=Neodiprion virginianus TaxID=2961670 RepID=UPI001EE74477|nr:odorant receptor Or2-like [Neodiprion virginianus]
MEKYVLLNLWAIRVLGIWHPEKNPSRFRHNIYGLQRSLTVGSVLFIFIPAAIAVQDNFSQNSNLSTRVEILSLLISSSVVLCKTMDIVLRRNQVHNLLSKMSEYWRGATSEEISSMAGYARFGKSVTNFYFTLGGLSSVFFAGQPFLSSYFAAGRENSSTVVVSRLPFNGWENLVDHRSTSTFAVVFVCHVIAGTVASLASISYDCLFAVLVLHVCGNLRAVVAHLRNMKFDNEDESEGRIIRCAVTFQKLIEYTKELENCLSMFLLIQTTSSTLTICLTGFLMSRDIDGNNELGKYVSYWAASLFQLFIFCWSANYLQTESIMVGQAAYEAYGKLMNLSLENNRRRYHRLANVPRHLQMIILRSQKPLKITAGKFYVMSLETYKNILSNSYSYFTILRAFADIQT